MKQKKLNDLELTDIQKKAINYLAVETTRDLQTTLSLIIAEGINLRFGEFSDYRVIKADELAEDIKKECNYKLGLLNEENNKTSYKFDGHINKEIINNVLNDQYLTSMCVEDYLSSMNKKELDNWIKQFINEGIIKKEVKTND